jgi:hypothetical protein
MDGRYPRGFVVSLLARSCVYNKTMAIIQVVRLHGVFMVYSCYRLPRKRVAGGKTYAAVPKEEFPPRNGSQSVRPSQDARCSSRE